MSDRFVFRFSTSPATNSADFLRAHPELVDSYPELVPLLDPDTQLSAELTTAFARTIASDPVAYGAFSRYLTTQGLDLSRAPTGG